MESNEKSSYLNRVVEAADRTGSARAEGQHGVGYYIPWSHPVLRIWDTSTDTKRWQVDHVGHVPAFTVADLLGMLPPDIPDVGEQNHDYFLTLSNGFCWCLRYENSRMPHMYIGEKLEFDLIVLLCDRIEWLLSNGYKLEV